MSGTHTTETTNTEDRVWAIHRANFQNERVDALARVRARLVANQPSAAAVLAAMKAAA